MSLSEVIYQGYFFVSLLDFISLYTNHKHCRFYPIILISNPPQQILLLTKSVPVLHRQYANHLVSIHKHNAVTLICYKQMGLITDCFEYNVFYLIFFHQKVYMYNKRIVDIVISSKKRDSLSLQ